MSIVRLVQEVLSHTGPSPLPVILFYQAETSVDGCLGVLRRVTHHDVPLLWNEGMLLPQNDVNQHPSGSRMVTYSNQDMKQPFTGV